MARTGRPPLPIEVKRRKGTLRPGRLPNHGLGIVAVSPIDPATVGMSALKAFEAVVADGVPWWVNTDAIVVGLLRRCPEDCERVRLLAISR